MSRTLSTGVIDLQLIGLPDVKRQLKDIPRLMDGVAKATLGFVSRLRREQIGIYASITAAHNDASAKRAAALTAEANANQSWLRVNQLQMTAQQRAAARLIIDTKRARSEAHETFATKGESGLRKLGADKRTEAKQLDTQIRAAYQAQNYTLMAQLQRDLSVVEAQKAEITSIMQDLKTSQKAAGTKAERKVFDKSAVGNLRQFREATLGTETLAVLDQESLALDRLSKKIDMTDVANQKFIASERERIRVSREAIELEKLRVLAPEKFAAKTEAQHMKEGFGAFVDIAEQNEATAALNAKKQALAEFSQTLDDNDPIAKAYRASLEREIEFEERSVERKKGIGRELVLLGSKRDDYLAKQAKGIPLTSAESAHLAKLSHEFDRLAAEMEKADNESKQFQRGLQTFNEKLKAFGQGSRIGNFAMQQLSYGAQDFVQVIGQTGVAGALHASANNLSAFVQTLDIANPAILALTSFGVTAGMIGLSEWLKRTKQDTDRLTDAIREYIDVQKKRRGIEESAKSQTITSLSPDLRQAAKELQDAKAELSAHINFPAAELERQAVKAKGSEAALLAGQAGVLRDQDVSEFRDQYVAARAKESAQQIVNAQVAAGELVVHSVSKLMEQSLSSTAFVARQENEFNKLTGSMEAMRNAYKLGGEELKKKIDEERKLITAVELATEKFNRLEQSLINVDFGFRKTNFETLMKSLGPDALGTGTLADRLSVAHKAIEAFTFDLPEDEDIGAARQRIANQQQQAIQKLTQEGILAPSFVQEIDAEFQDAFKELGEKEKKNMAKVSSIFESMTHLDPLPKQLDAINKQLQELMQVTSNPQLIAHGQMLAAREEERIRREHRKAEATKASSGLQSVMQSLAPSLSDDAQKGLSETLAHADRMRQIQGLTIPGPMRQRLQGLSLAAMQANIAGAKDNRVGFADPASLHRTIQQSLKDNKQTALQEKANAILSETLGFWKKNLRKEGITITE